MSRLQITETKLATEFSDDEQYMLILDGELIKPTDVPAGEVARSYSIWQPIGENTYIVNIYRTEIAKTVNEFPFYELSDSIRILHTLPNIEKGSISISFSFIVVNSKFYIESTISLDSENWKGLWSASDFSKECRMISTNFLQNNVLFHNEDESEDEDADVDPYGINSYFSFYFPIDDINSNLRIERSRLIPVMDDLIEQTNNSLQDKIDENSFVQYFKFPEGLQGSCEEYLWSFIQFLKEVGVNATAELKQDRGHAGQVLFSVTPTRGKAVLGKVKQALELYIQLAGTSNFEFAPNAPISADIIQARISSFQSQLSLAQASAKMQLAEIRANEKTIQAQETTIQSQQVMLDRVNANNVFLLSRVEDLESEASKKSEEQIRLLNGIVKIGDASKYGVSVNIPKLLAAVKRAMQDDSIPSILYEDLGLPALPPHDDDNWR